MKSASYGHLSHSLSVSTWFNYIPMRDRGHRNNRTSRPVAGLISALGVASMTAAISVSGLDKSIANISMLYLIAVIGSAVLFGRVAAVLTSLMSFLALDFFFTQPHFHLTVQNPSEWLALCIFLFTAIVTGQLTALVRARAEEAERSKREATALARASWAVASEPSRNQALQMILEQTIPLLSVRAACIIDCQPVPAVIARFNEGLEQDEFERFLSNCRNQKPDDREVEETVRVMLSQPLPKEEWPIVFYLRGLADSPNQQHELFKAVVTHLKLVIGRDHLRKVESQAAALLEADRLKTALLSMVSHDFRSPLTSIKTSVGSLLHDGTPLEQDSQALLLQGIEQETDRLNRLVGNVLDLSRLEAGAWMPRKEPTLIAELISAALDAFNAEQNKRIKVEIDRTIDEVSADSVQIVQVLKNLIENALKYSPVESDIYVIVRGDENQVVFEVSDAGIGLPTGYEERIFEPFFRAPEHKESSVPGLGIGLAVCRGLVQSHGGTLLAESRNPKGSRFQVVLPKMVVERESSHC